MQIRYNATMAFEGFSGPHPDSSKDVSPLSVEDMHFHRGIEKLKQAKAGSLSQRWEDEYEALLDRGASPDELHTFFDRFQRFEEKRERALISLDITEGLDPKLIEEVMAFDRDVIASFRDGHLFQGNGATAEVYEVAGHAIICVKFITNQERYNENNHLRVEFDFLKQVRDLSYGNVRTPIPYFLRIHPNEGHSMGMERVDGKSLSQILENRDEELIDVAQKMDRAKIASDLKGFIELMHSRGITHNDLWLRNMMIDHEGNFYVIDFGKAKREFDENKRVMQQEGDRTLADSELKKFFQEIDKLNN